MPIVASSQLTLTDVYDSKQLALSIRPSRQTSVIYDGISVFQPDYAVVPQELTPEVSVLGEAGLITNGITSCTWTKRTANLAAVPVPGTDPAYSTTPIGTGALTALVIAENPVANTDLVSYEATVTYLDPVLNESITLVASCDIRRITNGVTGKSAITLNLTNDNASLSADADGVVADYSSMQTELEVLSGVTDVTSEWTITTMPSIGVSGTQTGAHYQVTDMTVDDGTVLFQATKSGLTYEKWFSVSKIRRGEDAYRIEIVSSNGNLFKNGVIDTVLSAKLYKGDEDITTATGMQYFIWTRTSADPAGDSLWNQNHAAGKKSITITDADVQVRATFNCQYINA